MPVGMLTVAWMLAACSPEVTIQESPSTKAPPTQRSEPQPSRTLPEPTEPSLPLTNTPLTNTPLTNNPSPQDAPESAFGVCDKPPDDLALSKSHSQQEGLSLEIDRLIPPAPPANASFSLSDETVAVTWQGTGTDVDEFYNIYRLREGEDCWELVGIEPVEGQNQGVYTFNAMVTDRQGGDAYGVATVDLYNNESDLSIAEPGP